MKRILKAVFLTIIFSQIAQLEAEEYSVVITDIPKPVTMSFYNGFKLANTHDALKRRQRFLEYYESNKSIRGNYNEILMMNWEAEDVLPSIVVGSLYAIRNNQGKINQESWKELKAAFEMQNKQQISAIRDKWRPLIEKDNAVPLKVQDDLIWIESQSDENSVIILGLFRLEIDGKLKTIFSARKFIYHKGYMVFANVHVDSSEADALKLIKIYLSAINVKSIN